MKWIMTGTSCFLGLLFGIILCLCGTLVVVKTRFEDLVELGGRLDRLATNLKATIDEL